MAKFTKAQRDEIQLRITQQRAYLGGDRRTAEKARSLADAHEVVRKADLKIQREQRGR